MRFGAAELLDAPAADHQPVVAAPVRDPVTSSRNRQAVPVRYDPPCSAAVASTMLSVSVTATGVPSPIPRASPAPRQRLPDTVKCSP
jgi:hypothetical protein